MKFLNLKKVYTERNIDVELLPERYVIRLPLEEIEFSDALKGIEDIKIFGYLKFSV